MEKKSGYKGIFIFFLVVIVTGTLTNLMEFLLRTEPEGRIQGLNTLSTVEDTAINVWGGIQYLMGKRVAYGTTTYEDVTLLSNGYATMADVTSGYEPAILGAERGMEIAMEVDADFLYVQVPSKQRYEEEFPNGVVNYSMEKHNAVVGALEEQGIPVLDMWPVLENTERDWYEYFYISDHHWRNNAAFLAYTRICEYMKECGFSINEEFLSEDNYEKILYEDVFLGTHARMAGIYYAGLDDYELWLPSFETEFTLRVPEMGIEEKGTFEDCFIHYENLKEPSFDYYAYYAYLGEDYNCIEIVNERNPEGAHVIIVRDSEAVPVSVFLASQCSEIDILDLRYPGELNLTDYIREQSPDLILYIFGTGYLGNENAMILP